jgi:hypothetical protein
MRKILLTTTALVALGSVSAVAADVSLSGNVRFRYQAWSDDVAAAGGTNNSAMVDLAFIDVKTSETTDNGLALSTRTRFREGGGMDLNMISIGGDFGTLTFGNQWNLSHLKQLSESSIATVAGGGYVQADAGTPMADMNGTGFLSDSDKDTKLTYNMPAMGGFSAGVGFKDAGAASMADETDMYARYVMPVGAGSLTVNYSSLATEEVSNGLSSSNGNEVGVSYSSSFGRVYALQLDEETETAAGGKTKDQQINTYGVTYNVNDNLKALYWRVDNDEDGSTNAGDTLSVDHFGARYKMAGGLQLGLLHANHKFTDASAAATSDSGSSTRVQIRMNF